VLRQSFQGYFQASARRDFCFTGLDAGQDLFIFNLKFMDDNDVMKKDLVEMKTSKKLKYSSIQCSEVPSGARNSTLSRS